MKQHHYVYMVRCRDGSLYTGYTTDVERRVLEHNGEGGGIRSAGARYTHARRPVSLVYVEKCTSRSVALKREHALKSLARSKKEVLIATSTDA